jgi:hypothetical protein
VLTYGGFSEQELNQIGSFYVRLDNAAAHAYGALPEYSEQNNVAAALLDAGQRYYLPSLLRQ